MDKENSIIRMYSRSTVAVVMVFLMSHSSVFSQDLEIRNVHFERGRSLSMITDMDQDDFGYLWFSTHENGLLRYDGKTLERIPFENTQLGSMSMETILVDRAGLIWVGDFNKGLYNINPITREQAEFSHSEEDQNSISDDGVRTIFEDSKGTFWVGTAKGLDTLDRNTGKFYSVKNTKDSKIRLHEEQIRTIVEDKNGIIWVGCGSATDNPVQEGGLGGLYRIDKKSKEIIKYEASRDDPNALINPNVRAVFEDSRGVFWVGTAGDGLHTMDRSTGKFTRYLFDQKNPSKLSRPNYDPEEIVDHITFINEDSQGFIWIGTLLGGLNRYDPRSEEVTYFGTEGTGDKKVIRNDHWACLKTEDGSLWISDAWVNEGTADQRLLVVNSESNNKSFYNSLESWVIGFAEDNEGTLWLGTSNGIFRRNVDGTHTNFQIDNPESEQGLNTIYEIKDGQDELFCLSSAKKVYKFDKKSHQFEEILSGHDWYDDLLLDDGGVLWITCSAGLLAYDTKNQKVLNVYNELNGLEISSFFTNKMIEDSEVIWIPCNKGILKFDKKTPHLELFDYFEFVTQIEFDASGVLYGSSAHSLFRFDTKDGSFVQMKDSFHLIEREGYPNGPMTISENGHVWLAKNNAIVKYDPQTGNAFLVGPSWINEGYTLVDRMLYRTKDNMFLIGTNDGYYLMPGEWSTAEAIVPRPFLVNLRAGNRVISLISSTNEHVDKEINLKSDESNIEIEFGNIDLTSFDIEQNLVYKLDNYNDDWMMARNVDEVNFSNLSPGNYTFRLKASDKYGKMSEVSQSFTINAPWYKTLWAYTIFALCILVLIFAFDRFMRRKLILKERKRSLEKELFQAKEIKKAYTELKATQSQLIQSEKMASLGELTAGIAHEIQNPLNFVKNFSEVSTELIDEMIDDLKSGKQEAAAQLASEIKENQERINHHGKRAGSIVRGMLQHSRTSSGELVETDINILCDEYLRLSYHGLRAKDKSFNADLQTDLAKDLPRVKVVPQDLGRVLLNLINNAFYAVKEKSESGIDHFKPFVEVSTKLLKNMVEIKVVDNGNGVPTEVKEKIFQPFFTTKPSGKGTGLGLSLSYDIVKAHGGALILETKEGKGSEFIIKLPV